MRYHDKSLPIYIFMICVWTFIGVSIMRPAMQHRDAFRVPEFVLGASLIIVQIASYWLMYWQIDRNGVVERRLWKRREQSYSNITYVGPVTGKKAGSKALNGYIEIRSGNDAKMIAVPAKRDAFLAALHSHLPEEIFYD